MEILAARERKVEGGAADRWDQLASQREREGRAVGASWAARDLGRGRGLGRARGVGVTGCGAGWASAWFSQGLLPFLLFFYFLFSFPFYFPKPFLNRILNANKFKPEANNTK